MSFAKRSVKSLSNAFTVFVVGIVFGAGFFLGTLFMANTLKFLFA